MDNDQSDIKNSEFLKIKFMKKDTGWKLSKTNKKKKEVWKVSNTFNGRGKLAENLQKENYSECSKPAENLKQENYSENDNTHKGKDDNGVTNLKEPEVVDKNQNRKISLNPPDKCPYEIVRDENIAERDRRLKDLLADIQKDNKEIVEENEKRKRKPRRKAEKVVQIGEPRKSLRAKRKVNYDEKDDKFAPAKKRKITQKATVCSNEEWKDSSDEEWKDSSDEEWKESSDEEWKESSDKEWKESSDEEWKESSDEEWKESSDKDWKERSDEEWKESTNEDLTKRIPRRTGKKPNYVGVAEDEFIYCERCREEKFHGCEIHPLRFDYVPEIDICPSNAGRNGRNAGRGVFNIGRRIPEGVMFGPYQGTSYTQEQYDVMKSFYGESGYAWEVKDGDKEEVVTYVDPGPNPHPRKNWLAIVNMPVKTRLQNMIAVQYMGKIYYLTVREISHGEEFLVDYGNDYARELGINVDEKDLYEGYENWEEDCVTCPYCKNTFTNKESLKKHIDKTSESYKGGCMVLRWMWNKVDVVAGSKPHVCEVCGKGFKYLSELKDHKPVHSDETPYQCTDCEKWFKHPRHVRSHKRSVHSGKKFYCPKCEKPFPSKSNMEKHLRDVCNREKAFKCDQCGRSFGANDSLKKHIQTVHGKAHPFKCDKCEKRFKTKYALKDHVKFTHEGVRPFQCEDCDFSFAYSTGLEMHRIARHTFQFKIYCEICEKGILSPYHLKQHMMRFHPTEYQEKIEKEKPAQCPKCKKRFPSDRQVEIHVKRMHTD